VIMPKIVTKAPAMKDHAEYATKIKGQTAGYSNRVIPALKADADIEDNRFDFN
jgi:peptidyl-prolyl cis-trans isomerase D